MRTAKLLLSLLVILLGGCTTHESFSPAYIEIEHGLLPAANTTLDIPNLGPCTDNPDRSLHLDSSQPVTILVHGMSSSSGALRGLAQIFAYHGQQTACFSYDDRIELSSTALELREAINHLVKQTHTEQVTLIGHSLGALISRRSLTSLPEAPLPGGRTDFRLVTIAGPFDGISSAKDCGRTWLRIVTLGLLPATCHMITGAKWEDINAYSPFIRKPGRLIAQVSGYLKIDTDERNSCRSKKGERCEEDDYVFSLAEQRNALIESDSRMRRVDVVAGHVAIIGNRQMAPTLLIGLLQQYGILNHTPPAQEAAFKRMLQRTYLDEVPAQ